MVYFFRGFCLAASIAAAAPVLSAPTGTLPLPPRSPSAMTGSQFYTAINGLPDAQREQMIVNEIATGNIPSFLRTLKPITVQATIAGVPHIATYFTTCDYLAIGSDTDYFRMPMSAPLAQQIADVCACSLPTRKMVNDIYTNCQRKLAPYPFSPATYDIDSVPVFWLSQQAIENQRTQAGAVAGELIGGIKKDVVITPQTPTRPSPARVAIYGWHQLNGSPIQPLSLVHESTYEDYSHGIRLVESTMVLDALDATVTGTLASSAVAALLSDEGAFTAGNRYPIPSPYPLPNTNPNLVNNGSFENGFTAGVGNGWISWLAAGSNAYTFGQASVNKYDGALSQYWKRSDTLAADGGVYQTVPVTQGATYQITAYLKRQSTFANTFLLFGYDATGGTNGTAQSVTYADLTGPTDDVWVPYSASVVASSANLTLIARCGHVGTTGDTSAYFYLDAVSVIKTADAPPQPPPNLVNNGSFENGFTAGVGNGWTKWQAAGSNTITAGQASANKYDGTYSQYFSRSDTALFDGGVYQTIAVAPGATYQISARMKRQSLLAGTSMKVGYDLSGGTNGAAAGVTYTDITGATDNVWNSYAATFTATGNSVTLFARGGHTGTTGGTNSYFYFDAVSLTQVP